MTTERDVRRALDIWMAEGPNEVNDFVLDSVERRISGTPQRPGWLLSRRFPTMQRPLRLAAAAAAVVVITFVGWQVMPRSGAGPGGLATPSPARTTAATTAPSIPPLPPGPIHAGDYAMRAFAGDSLTFVVTAPEGWQGFGGFFLAGPGGTSTPDGIAIAVNHDPMVPTEPCDSSIHTQAPGGRPPSIDDLTAAISARDDLQVSSISDTSLAGYTGKRLDVEFPATLACANHYLFAEPKGLYAQGVANRWRVWLLEVQGETAVVALLDYATTPAASRATAEAAISSIRILP